MTNSFDVANDRFTRGIIRRKAFQIIRRPGLSEQDIEPLEQTMLSHVIQVMDSFDPEIAHRNVFITTVVERFVKSYLRDRRAKKRGPEHVRSLNVDVFVPGELPTQLQYTLDDSVGDARLQVSRRTTSELRELASDIAFITSTLPEPWQRMLELRKSYSMCQIAELMKVPRSTLRYWMKQVAEKFEEAGLREYLA